jgi:hypothetical protein
LVTQPAPDCNLVALIRPKYYAHENALVSTGFTPRYLRATAEKMGVHVFWPNDGRRWCVDADEFDAALKREREQAARQVRSIAPEPVDEAEELRRRLGLVRK